MSLYGPIVLTSDAAGNATATTEYLEGELQCIYLIYDGAAPGGTDVIIYDATRPVPPAVANLTYLNLVNNNINGVWFPRIDCNNNAGAAVYYDAAGAGFQVEVRDNYYMANPVTIDVAQIGAAGRTVTVYIYYSDFK